MLNDDTIEHLKRAIHALEHPNISAGAFEALAPLSALVAGNMDLTIDMRASTILGAPVILAHSKTNASRLPDCLTTRQRDVAELIIAGHSNKSIARELGISLATVKDHVHAILQRLGLSSRTELFKVVR